MTKRYISPQSGPVDTKTNKDSHYRSQEQETPKEVVVGAYLPADSEVKEAYQRGEFVNKAMSEQRWQRWLRTVKADAWDEGYIAAVQNAFPPYGQTGEPIQMNNQNPYESEGA
ncbi:MAG: hypothetical protein ABF966_09790 [Bifidobacterium psychraerophilum]|uniref:hypothetical protein n=1 Tax=Bifidobacterium psychraerophilum TaxID=218140 RepID=UPI0039EC4D6C